MGENKISIIFMGSPEFAIPSLEILLNHGYHVKAVITATDKLAGRGNKKVLESAIKKYAKKKELKILQPKNLKAESFVNVLKEINADLQVVVAFRMLPEVVWSMPPLGTVNLHASLLPKYRGAAPINWAIIMGEKETGLTTFFIKHEIDTGDVLFQEKLDIKQDDTAGSLHDRMKEIGAQLVLKTVQAIENQSFTLKKQDQSQISKAPKIFHETCQIDFHQPTDLVYNFIRGLSPYPTAWTVVDDKKLKIFHCNTEYFQDDLEAGTIDTDNKTYLKIKTWDGYISFKTLQQEGRKKMDIQTFLNGNKIEDLKIH